jgi:hypothetical protein
MCFPVFVYQTLENLLESHLVLHALVCLTGAPGRYEVGQTCLDATPMAYIGIHTQILLCICSTGSCQFVPECSFPGWQRTVFTEQEQVLKYLEQAFRPSEQMFRYLEPGTGYQIPEQAFRYAEHRTRTPNSPNSVHFQPWYFQTTFPGTKKVQAHGAIVLQPINGPLDKEITVLELITSWRNTTFHSNDVRAIGTSSGRLSIYVIECSQHR